MAIAVNILLGLIILIHLYIVWFEMFAWTSRGPKVFRSFSKDLFPKTKTLAANQGLYNAFLVAGLVWTFVIHDVVWKTNVSLFFLSCVSIAGVYGALTAERKIFFVQAMPAIIALVLILIK